MAQLITWAVVLAGIFGFRYVASTVDASLVLYGCVGIIVWCAIADGKPFTHREQGRAIALGALTFALATALNFETDWTVCMVALVVSYQALRERDDEQR